MDKAYMETAVHDRRLLLEKRYYLYCKGTNDMGQELTYGGSAHTRSRIKQEIGILSLVMDLLKYIKPGELNISDAGERALDRLTEPKERYRNVRV